MIKFTDYIKINNSLINLTFGSFDYNVVNYIEMFDNIIEEPLFKNDDGVVIYVSKKNNQLSFWVEYNSNIYIKKQKISNINDIINYIIL